VTNPAITPESIAKMLADTAPTFPEGLAIEPLAIDDECAVGALTVERRHLHPGEMVHGGVWTGLGDTVAAWQTFRHLPDGWNFTTVELKLNALAGAVLGDRLVATARHLHAGRSTHVIETRIVRERDGTEKLGANLIVTQFVIPGDKPL
jgi:uncharacterized protein (TIGR00369 family)